MGKTLRENLIFLKMSISIDKMGKHFPILTTIILILGKIQIKSHFFSLFFPVYSPTIIWPFSCGIIKFEVTHWEKSWDNFGIYLFFPQNVPNFVLKMDIFAHFENKNGRIWENTKYFRNFPMISTPVQQMHN